MEELDVSWEKTIPVWWSFFWRASLFGFLGGALLGLLAGVVVGAIGRPDLATTAGTIAGYVVGVPISMWCIKKILGMSFNGYSVRLVKTEST